MRDGGTDAVSASRSTAPSGLPRPSRLEEAIASRLLRLFGPRSRGREQPEPPDFLAPFRHATIPRRARPGRLVATFFSAGTPARGTVVLLHPWTDSGRAYLLRHGRIPALRNAGYDVVTVDLGGFGASSATRGFQDLDVEDALDAIAQPGGPPLHVWGISAGGVWAHPALTRTDAVAGAIFEDVSPHLLEWSGRNNSRWRPFFRLFRAVFPNADRYLDMRRHASRLRVRTAAYVSGAVDHGVRPEDTRNLARSAGATHRIIAGADHLQCMKVGRADVLDLALSTLAQATESSSPPGTAMP